MNGRMSRMLIAVAIAAIVACSHGGKVNPTIASGEPLLLLDNPGPNAQPAASAGPVADNSRCHVCHMNYADEPLAVGHARGLIGCEDCHGSCDAHCGDENNVTPPDIMYPEDKVDPFCLTCHPEANLTKENHTSFFAGETKEKRCAECHGKHRLEYRTRRWDKTTGKLIADDKVRMMPDKPAKP